MDWENYGRERHTGKDSTAPEREEPFSVVEGNTVRKLSAVPEREPEPQRRPAPKHYPQRKPVAIPGISARAFIFLSVLLVAVFACSFSYLTRQEDVRQMKSEIVALQSEVSQMQEENEEVYQSIVEGVDLSEIYRRATNELNMVQAKNNQIYTYSDKKSDAIKQYADIPGAK